MRGKVIQDRMVKKVLTEQMTFDLRLKRDGEENYLDICGKSFRQRELQVPGPEPEHAWRV